MTTIAVMQPYFLPYAGYFRLFAEADLVCVFDCVQFPRRGYVHRNQLPGVAGQPHWLTLPLAKSPMNVRIADLRFADDAAESLRSRARAFPVLRDVRHPLLDAVYEPTGDVVSYLMRLLSIACMEMGLPSNVLRTTSLQIPYAFSGQERILEICRRLQANRYINLSGGRRLYDANLFERQNVELALFEPWTGANWSILYRLLTEPAGEVARQIRAQI